MTCKFEIIVVIDSREAQLKVELSKVGHNYETQQLPVGDVIISRAFLCDCSSETHPKQEMLIIYERKTLNDFYSSIVSGRYAEQRERLKLTGTKVAYILEGYSPTTLFGKDITLLVHGALENLVLYHNIFILPTLSVEQTAKSIMNMKAKLEKKDMSKSMGMGDPVQLVPRKDKVMENIHGNQLLLIPGVSTTVAKLLLDTYPTLRSLISAYDALDSIEEKQNMLANIVVGKKKLGKVVSKRIYDIYNSS